MNIQLFLTLYAISIPIFFAIDMVWLGFVASDFYRSRLGHLLGDINWPAAIIFYLIFLVGLTLFVTYPGVMKNSLSYVVLWGALFGFFTYATYDLTNLSTMRDFPLVVALVDIVWGTVLGASVAAVTYLVYGFFQ